MSRLAGIAMFCVTFTLASCSKEEPCLDPDPITDCDPEMFAGTWIPIDYTIDIDKDACFGRMAPNSGINEPDLQISISNAIRINVNGKEANRLLLDNCVYKNSNLLGGITYHLQSPNRLEVNNTYFIFDQRWVSYRKVR